MDDPHGSLPSGELAAPALHYAPARPRRGARLHRLLQPGSPAFLLLLFALLAAGVWGTWKLRLRADEQAFNARAKIDAANRVITFSQPPDAASIRHLARLPGMWRVFFRWRGDQSPSAPLALRGQRLSNVRRLDFGERVDVDPWLKEIARPNSGFKSLTILFLPVTRVTDAGLKELARPDSGLKSVRNLNLDFTGTTDAGLRELSRPNSGIGSLTELALKNAPVTDAGLRELARPDSGLKALVQLGLDGTRVTDAGLSELARPDSSLKSLTWLGVGGTDVTYGGVKSLKKARPALEVEN
jgi:hypothetical protein